MNHIMLDFFDVDLVTILITCLLATCGETGAGIFAFSQGLLFDVFTAGPLGLFTLLYLTLFLAINLFGSRFFDLRSPRGQFIIISVAVLLKEIFFITYLSSLEIRVSSSIFWAATASAMCSGLIGPFVFYLLSQLNHFLTEGSRRASDEWT